MMVSFFEALGVLGLLVITIGVLWKEREQQDILFIIGGALLASYSLSLRNTIFVLVQTIFVAAAAYDLAKLHFGSGGRK